MSLTYDVWATKDGMKRRFTQSCWDLVGPNKNGWTLMEDSVISNVLDSVEKPSTGQKTILNSNMENILIEKPILNPNIENILIENKDKCNIRADLSKDCKINLVDFSMLAFWYKKPNPKAEVDLNKDGIVNLVDFSIMAYNWTG